MSLRYQQPSGTVVAEALPRTWNRPDPRHPSGPDRHPLSHPDRRDTQRPRNPILPAERTRKPGWGHGGVATLEFVMCIPLLATMMVLLVWLGFSVIGKAQVTTAARAKAWGKRFQESPGNVLLFLKDDFVSEKATQPVKISPIVDRMPPPTSKHVVMTSTWDHTSLPMDSAPHWKLYATVAVNAKTAGLQNGYTDAKNLVDNLAEVGQGALASLLDGFGSMDDLGDKSGSGASDEEKKQREQMRQDKLRLEQEIQRLDKEILSTLGDIQATEVLILAEKDAEKKKALERELALQKVRLERMQSDRHDAKEELDAINEALD